MCFFLCGLFTLILGWNGASSQVPDYETTPFPLPPTGFSCQGRLPGYYADLETGCRTYHVCDGNSHFTYICPARTLFRQRSRICDHAYLVRCEDAPFEDVYSEDSLRSVESEDGTESADGEFSTTETPEIPTTTTTRKPTTVAIEKSQNGNVTSSQANKILKFVIKDARSLFYIPEVDNNSITVQAERAFALQVDRKNPLRFKNGKKARHAFSACPGYCDPKFFLPGTCHPCIVIK